MGAWVRGERAMTQVVIDVVLFSCIFVLVTGIVLTAAHFLI